MKNQTRAFYTENAQLGPPVHLSTGRIHRKVLEKAAPGGKPALKKRAAEHKL